MSSRSCVTWSHYSMHHSFSAIPPSLFPSCLKSFMTPLGLEGASWQERDLCCSVCVWRRENLLPPLSLWCHNLQPINDWSQLRLLQYSVLCVFVCVCSECWHGFVVFLAFHFACDIFATHFPCHKVRRISISDIWFSIIIKYILILARLAQSVEHDSLNLRVVSVKPF